eukprot:48313-Eustigmatos_ZCMA.PRE.1
MDTGSPIAYDRGEEVGQDLLPHYPLYVVRARDWSEQTPGCTGVPLCFTHAIRDATGCSSLVPSLPSTHLVIVH